MESEPQARWHGHTLVIGEDDADLPTDLLHQLPIEPDRCTVLVLDTTTPNADTLQHVLATRLPGDIGSVRLALSQAGDTGLAQHLADRMDLEIVSPDGPVVLLPPGALYVTSPEGVGGWWTHRPGQPATRQGPHHPAPDWRVDLPARRRLRRPALSARAIPCGIWLYARDRRAVAGDDPAFAIPADPDRVTVLIGRPGGRSVTAKALYGWLAALPRDVVERLTLMPYGQDASLLDTVAGRLSDDLLVTVHRTAGIPALGADGATFYATVDRDGQPSGRRIVQHLSYQSGSRYDVNAWLSPLTGHVEPGHHPVPLGQTWVLEVVRSGLWLRDAANPDNHAVRQRPVEPDGDVFLVDAAGDEEAELLARQIAAGLPTDVPVRWEITPAAEPEPDPAADPTVSAAEADGYDHGDEPDDAEDGYPPDAAAPPAFTPAPALAPVPRSAPPPAVPPSAVLPTVPPVALAAPPPIVLAPAGLAPIAPPPAPPTPLPPAALPPAAVPPIAVPPAAVPPIAVPPAAVPPIAVPAETAIPTLPVLRPHVGGGSTAATERSTPAQQRMVREHLGGRYDVHARTVARLLVQMPGIRPGPGETTEALVADLVTVAALLSDTDPLSPLSVELLRPCLASGLGRLPTFFGGVLAPAPAQSQRWQPGELLTSVTVLRADGSGPGEFGMLAIYSMTGRRASVLSPRDEVLFGPGTMFRVLDVERHRQGGLRVFLRENTTAASTGPTDQHVLEALRAGAERPR